MRVAVIGAGAMGRNHARIYHDFDAAELVAVVDPDPAAEAVARKYNCKYYPDYEEMLVAERPEAVSVATPTVTHKDIGIRCLRQGVHCLVEKPIASSIAEADTLIAAAAEAGVTLQIGHIERFNPAVVELKRRVEQGELGTVFRLEARRQSPFPPRIQDIGVIMDLAVHDIDIMLHVHGAPISHLYAQASQRLHALQFDLFDGLIRFSDGVVGSLGVNWLTPTKIRQFFALGERGMFKVNYITQELFFYENGTRVDFPDYEDIRRSITEGNVTRIALRNEEPLRKELVAFLESARTNSRPPVTGEDGRRALEVALRFMESAEQNRIVAGVSKAVPAVTGARPERSHRARSTDLSDRARSAR
ncbi:Gfo/Idh/MocA family oxidoreductase [Candidatus Woesearchaeota archaeon]|nr:Gfo/Idh/MocA family oxidoreductase [Candidatus Woesearchaeota archaeon]